VAPALAVAIEDSRLIESLRDTAGPIRSRQLWRINRLQCLQTRGHGAKFEAMSKGRDRTVSSRPDGWTEKRNDASRAGGIYKTQGEAIAAAPRRCTARVVEN
jgi:hypothetical protein